MEKGVAKGSMCLLLLVLCINPPALAARANADEVVWGTPFRLTAEDSIVQYSAVAVDLDGRVHVFWTYAADSGAPTNLLYHRYQAEGSWSEETDIFAGADWDAFSRPVVACDRANRLHLLWKGLQGLSYSMVPAAQAHDPKSWQERATIAQADVLGATALVAAPDGTLHVVYSQSRAGTNVMYLRSEDGGATWSDPQPLSDIMPSDPQAPDSASMAIDSRGTLHVVWHESYPPEWLGRQVLYAQSTDGGRTWMLPRALSEISAGAAWNALPNVVVGADDNLYVMWACGNPVVRCFRRSNDLGASWADSMQPFRDLIGAAGRDALVADPHGNLFWTGSLRYPQALYWSVLAADNWRDPPQAFVTEGQLGGLAGAHFPQMLVAQGNQLHLVLVESNGGPLWYFRGQTSYPQVDSPAPESLPTSAVAPTATPVPEPPAPAPTSTLRVPLDAAPAVLSEGNPLLWSTLAVVGLLIFVVIVSRKWRRF